MKKQYVKLFEEFEDEEFDTNLDYNKTIIPKLVSSIFNFELNQESVRIYNDSKNGKLSYTIELFDNLRNRNVNIGALLSSAFITFEFNFESENRIECDIDYSIDIKNSNKFDESLVDNVGSVIIDREGNILDDKYLSTDYKK